jgi:hypothetical protein
MAWQSIDVQGMAQVHGKNLDGVASQLSGNERPRLGGDAKPPQTSLDGNFPAAGEYSGSQAARFSLPLTLNCGIMPTNRTK